MADTETYSNVTYKQESGTLTLTDKVFHYQANAPSKTSVKCSWARVEKRQLSPPTSDLHMIKMILVSGKTAVFQVKDRKTLEDLRQDCQVRMEAAQQGSTRDFSQSQRDMEDKLDGSASRRSFRAWQDEDPKPRRASTSTNQRGKGNACGWCCVGSSLACLFVTCLICVIIAVAVFLVYWFVLKDSDAVNDVLSDTGLRPKYNESRPPDYGEESRYAIRSVHHEWNGDEVTLQYQLSDYILDSSVSYILYDGLDCRRSANDITRENSRNAYLSMELIPPATTEADLTNDGRGSRRFDLHFTLNKGTIHNAPFLINVGLEKAQLNFCIGLSVDYNQVEYWRQELEVNAVETAIQMDIDLTNFKLIEDVNIRTVIRPAYNRRHLSLLRGPRTTTAASHDIINNNEGHTVAANGGENEMEQQQ